MPLAGAATGEVRERDPDIMTLEIDGHIRRRMPGMRASNPTVTLACTAGIFQWALYEPRCHLNHRTRVRIESPSE
ncbi:uncharacterized protein BO97DRAFT_160682 [Aspergillus homomorphus CBS 101889]|uniref:Uncharacterized protein n=1 Tax=Aspergillus homomorphus (strain CBS 101889) TaxID=1450537 RepID=A0A395HQK9_ASPHC|nr:hypothetical protein BO97DRAFT_160682 [Aspergillus homomorphus CBS 101889]RAL09575.1 hypothetical protein BO97DRAFT_160682 [Aspergillus homomorphus CBS 101889]